MANEVGFASGFLPKLQGDPNAREAKIKNFSNDIDILFSIGGKTVDIQKQQVEFGSNLAKIHLQDNIRLHREMMTKYQELEVGRENDVEFYKAWDKDQKASLSMMVADADKYNNQPIIKEQYLNSTLDYVSRENAQFSPLLEKKIFNIDKTAFGSEIEKNNNEPKLWNSETLALQIQRAKLYNIENADINITANANKATIQGLRTNLSSATSGEGLNNFITEIQDNENGGVSDDGLIEKLNSLVPNDLGQYKKNEDGTIDVILPEHSSEADREHYIELYNNTKNFIVKNIEKNKNDEDKLTMEQRVDESVSKVIADNNVDWGADSKIVVSQLNDRTKALATMYEYATDKEKDTVYVKALKANTEEAVAKEIFSILEKGGGNIKLSKDYGMVDKTILVTQPNGANTRITLNSDDAKNITKTIIETQANKINSDLANGDITSFTRLEKLIPALTSNGLMTSLFPTLSNYQKQQETGFFRTSYMGSFNDIIKTVKQKNVMIGLDNKNLIKLTDRDKDFFNQVDVRFNDFLNNNPMGDGGVKPPKEEIIRFYNDILKLDKERLNANMYEKGVIKDDVVTIKNAIEPVSIFGLEKSKTKLGDMTATALYTYIKDKSSIPIKNMDDSEIKNMVGDKLFNIYHPIIGTSTTIFKPTHTKTNVNFSDDDTKYVVDRAVDNFVNINFGENGFFSTSSLNYNSDINGNLTITAIKDGRSYKQTYSTSMFNDWIKEKINSDRIKK